MPSWNLSPRFQRSDEEQVELHELVEKDAFLHRNAEGISEFPHGIRARLRELIGRPQPSRTERVDAEPALEDPWARELEKRRRDGRS